MAPSAQESSFEAPLGRIDRYPSAIPKRTIVFTDTWCKGGKKIQAIGVLIFFFAYRWPILFDRKSIRLL